MSNVSSGPMAQHSSFAQSGIPTPRRPLGYAQQSPPPPLRHRQMEEPYTAHQGQPSAGLQNGFHDYSSVPMSPVAKRRRFNRDSIYIPSRGEQNPQSPYSLRRPSLPPPEAIHPRPSIAMGPPTRAPPQSRPQINQDPSLTLPPLKTGGEGQTSGRSDNLESVISSLPTINKIRLLSRVAPSLPSPNQSHETRGAVLAVDGQDADTVRSLADSITDFLSKSGPFNSRIFTGPDPITDSYSGEKQDPTVEYLQAISKWHSISKEMTNFITRSRTVAHPAASTSPMEIDDDSSQSAISPKTVVVAPVQTPKDLASTDKATGDSPETDHQSQGPGSIPVAVIPKYQLSTVDGAALSIPIKDAYGALEHWQWAAAIWRGCVGPDVTVVVRDCDKEEIEKHGGGMPVETKLSDAKAIIVRRAKGLPGEKGSRLDEKALRRVIFEVEEYLRK